MPRNLPNARNRPAPPEPPAEPVLSQMGNPFPMGLTPVRVKYEELSERKPGASTGHPILREEDFPVDPARARPSDPYVYETFGPGDPDPPLRHHRPARDAWRTDAQHEAVCRAWEEDLMVMGVYHIMCQRLCTVLGNHRTCREGVCRRKRRCVSRRDESRFGIPFVVYPPCIPLDLEVMEAYRQEIGNELRRWQAAGAGKRG